MGSIADATVDLPTVGSDVGGFLGNLVSGGLASFLIILAIVGGLALLFTGLFKMIGGKVNGS